jgi:DNA-binding transcriptional LysR family regulator
MELRHLRYFVAVAEELHFGRAAERLYIAQSALSQQILSLEAELGIPLLERTKRRVQLTAAGQALLEDARNILHQVEQAIERSQRVARGEIGQLRIGFTILALHSILPPMLATFRKHYPKVQLVLSEMSTQAQLEALRHQQIDVGFLHPPINERDLELVEIKTEAMMVVLSSQHPLARRKRLTVRSLSPYPLIVHPRHEGPVLYDQILQLYANADCQPTIAQEATTSPTRIGLVATGIGITFVPEGFCALNYPGIVYKKLSGSVPRLSYGMAWQREDTAPLVQSLLNINRLPLNHASTD